MVILYGLECWAKFYRKVVTMRPGLGCWAVRKSTILNKSLAEIGVHGYMNGKYSKK